MIGGYFLGQKNFNMAFLSIGYDYVSVLALFAGSDIKWPSWMLRLFQILSIFNFNVDVTAPECLVPDLAFDKKWAAMMCLPLIIAAVFIVLWLGKLLFKLICKRKKKWRELNTHSSKLIATFTLLYYYMYTGLTRSALRIFKCEPVTPDDGFKYTDFTDLSCEGGLCRCDEGLQAQLQGPAILGLIFYTIGYPLFILIILKTYKNKIKEDQLLRAAGIGDDRKTTTSSEVYSVRKRWHKLYYHFKPGKTYWIFIIVMRKMWIAIAGLMFRGSPGFQLAVVLMILFASYVLQVQHRPYMSTAERDLVLEEHRRKASEGDPDHLRIQPVMAMAIERQRLVENALKIKKKKMKLKETFSGKSLVGFDESKNKKMKYFWDYNTIEATLLACGIVVCLSGVMFESGRFDGRPDLQWMYDLIGGLVAVVLVYSAVYYLAVFCSEVLGSSPRWLEECCANKKKGLMSDRNSNADMNDSEFEMAAIRNPSLQNNAQSEADRIKLATAEAQLSEMGQVNKDLVDAMRSQKKGWNNATTNPMKKKGRGKKKNKKEFGSVPIKGKKDKKKRRLSSRELISEMAEIQEQERDDVQHMKNVNYVISKKRPTHQKHISHDGKSYFQEIGTDKTVWTLPSNGVLLEEHEKTIEL